ncbi:MAG: hypothetical protein PW788_12955 [Micavibrio sp.]|nr:hypothetical protein [Micavibrio sp.]
MTTQYFKKLGRTTALAVAFALSAAAGQQAFAQNATPAYSDVAHRMDALADISKQIQMTKHTQDVLGLPQNTAEINDLKQSLKKAADITAPRILLTPGLTAQETQTLIDQYADKVGPLPEYLAKVNHKTKLVNVCTEELIPPDDTYTVALASSIANCVAGKKLADTPATAPATAPLEKPVQKVEAPAPVVPAAPVTSASTPANIPAAIPAPKTPASATKTSDISKLATPVNLGIAFGAAVLLLGGGAFGISRMRKKPAAAANDAAPANIGAVQNDTPPKPIRKFDL